MNVGLVGAKLRPQSFCIGYCGFRKFDAMTAKAARIELIEWLNGVNDPELLAAMLLFKKSVEAEEPLTDLTPAQMASIDRGLEDMRVGRVKSSEEVWKKYGL